MALLSLGRQDGCAIIEWDGRNDDMGVVVSSSASASDQHILVQH